MPDFGNLGQDAEKLAGQHSGVVDKGIGEAGQMVDDKTGGSEVREAEQHLGDQPGN
jgi:hypothetical protein